MKYLMITLLLFSFSCKKRSASLQCDETLKDATIIFTGSPALDGCGYMIQIDGAGYIADNLDEAFQKPDLKVNICYKLNRDPTACGIADIAVPYIHILDIRKR